MYKNIIFIVMDSLSFNNMDYLNKNLNLVKKYEDNAMVFDNIFSQAPYTEAALTALLTGVNILDYKGYLMNLKYKPYVINEIFRENGYKTFNSLWYYPNTLSFKRGVDDYYYIYSLSYTTLYNYRVKYYIELYKSNQLSEDHYCNIYEMFDDFFKEMEEYIDDYFNNPKRFEYLREKSNVDELDFDKYKDIINTEIVNYYKNKKKYIDNILNDKDIILKEIKDVTFYESSYYKKIKLELIKKCRKQSLLQLIKIFKSANKNKSVNVFNKYILDFIKSRDLSKLKYGIMNVLNYTGKPCYEMGSIKGNLDYIYDYLEENNGGKNFIYLHTMDTHFPFNFLSFDVGNKELIDKEFKSFDDAIKTNSGLNLFFEASIRYSSEKVTEFIDKLKESNIYKDSLVVITSDHGSSYLGEVYREKKVCTMYDENYKVPLVIIGENINGGVYNNYGSAVDILPTLLDLNDIDSDKYNFDGKSLLNNEREFITFEYMGSGCPDYNIKNKEITVRSSKYKVVAEVFLDKSYKIKEVYDIKKDPKELINICDSIKYNKDISKSIKYLEERIGKMR